jgi:hypothetical protein
VGFKLTIRILDFSRVKALERSYDILRVFDRCVDTAALLIESLTGNQKMAHCR